jgi:glycerol-3-phosphate O-acyltransferase/dihydroxyacetone phosphate acyltransferase
MQVPFPYLIARALVRAALAIYFRGLEVSGAKKVPAKGPVILAANHPQSVTDALVLAAAAPRAVRFIAHSGLFENRLRGWLLRSCGVIPVYRSGDKTDGSHDAGSPPGVGEPRGDAPPHATGALRGDAPPHATGALRGDAPPHATGALRGDAPPHATNALRGEAPPHAGHASRRNVEMFAACERALEEGGAIGIFPEGVSKDERRVHKLKTGTARIALQAESRNDWGLGVSIVPAGLGFESRRRMRTRVFVAFGDAIPAARYRETHRSDPVEAARSLSEDLEKAIARLVVDIERPEFEDLVREVELIYKGELVARQGIEKRRHAGAELGHSIEVEIPRALDYFLERRPEVVWRVRKLLRDYNGALERARMRDEVLREPNKRTLGGEIARLAAACVVGLPPAAYGILCNFVPYRLTGFVAHGMAKDETKIHYHQIVYGAVFFSLWYAPAVYVASRSMSPWGAVIFAASLPSSGLFALGFVRWLVRRGRRIQYIWLRMTHGRFVQELERRRRLVIAELDIALAEYIGARLEALSEPPREDRRG